MWQLSYLLSTDIERLGNPGWNWESLQRCMKKAERCLLYFTYKNQDLTRDSFASPAAHAQKSYWEAHAEDVEAWTMNTGESISPALHASPIPPILPSERSE